MFLFLPLLLTFLCFFFVSDVPNFGLEPFVVPTAAINADASAELRRGPPLLLHIPNCTQASPTPHPRFLSTVSCGWGVISNPGNPGGELCFKQDSGKALFGYLAHTLWNGAGIPFSPAGKTMMGRGWQPDGSPTQFSWKRFIFFCRRSLCVRGCLNSRLVAVFRGLRDAEGAQLLRVAVMALKQQQHYFQVGGFKDPLVFRPFFCREPAFSNCRGAVCRAFRYVPPL